MLKLPVGIQSFKVIQKEQYLYVDKTEHIYTLLTGNLGRYFFLARPRRFGKSLLLSTLSELLSCNRDLFKGLWIDTSDYAWQPHAVIYIDFSSIKGTTPDELKMNLSWEIEQIAQTFNIDVSKAPGAEAKLKSLIYALAKEHRIAILIDEYDRPLLHSITNLEVALAIQSSLRDFYATIKALGEHINFLLMTGVSKFAKTSVFSGLNNLVDLSLLKGTKDLLGYTEKELVQFFAPYIEPLAKNKGLSIEAAYREIRHWYNGYRFYQNAQTVYNPYSVLMYLSTGELRNHWFETGTPSFLVRLMQEKEYPVQEIENTTLNIRSLGSFEVDDLELIPLLFQTGYLTIKEYDSLTHDYKLGYPNEETKISFLHHFMRNLTSIQSDRLDSRITSLIRALATDDLEAFFATLKTFFASIPYTIQSAKENYYQSIFYVIMNLIGADVEAEVTINSGRIHSTITTKNRIYIFEFKLDGSAEKALEQISNKKYYEKFLQSGKTIMLVGANFDSKQRNIRDWLAQEVD